MEETASGSGSAGTSMGAMFAASKMIAKAHRNRRYAP